MSLKNPRHTKELRRQLRQNMTDAERLLWDRLRNKQLCDVRVKRQYGIGPYVLDFYVPKADLAIEVDGKIHLNKETAEKDVNKDVFLKRNQIDVIRIKNEEVFEDLDAVIRLLEKVVQSRLKSK
ncbi:endonuclease domain-containing protein [Gracilimonas mengyeensis]|uniref:Very-short-patch-repair endonuclease n=1 Tax=Gracilimonas mengyeensis TaxID=1302730 RepID=A0A521BTZ7_9BACT|nr:endonuclease domain-containing protein [Gracilimonas mengyeensis]SMO50628.1 Very-short-patch-repair endonuclease [Gracilimonas mengyeensis]